MKSVPVLLVLFVQCIHSVHADCMATLQTEIASKLLTFTQTLTADNQATFTEDFKCDNHRVFKISDMTCTLTVCSVSPCTGGSVSCTGGTLQIGADGVAPTMNNLGGELEYHTGTPDYITGSVNATAEAWTKYGVSLTDIQGKVEFKSGNIDEVYVKGTGSRDESPTFELTNVMLEASYARGRPATMAGQMTLKIGKQEAETSFPPLTVSASSVLGGDTAPVLDLQGLTAAPWKPLGDGGPTVDSLQVEARLTDAGLASIKVGVPNPFEFNYADFSLTVPTNVKVSEKTCWPTCTHGSWKCWGWRGRRMLFGSSPARVEDDEEPWSDAEFDPSFNDAEVIGRSSGTTLSFPFSTPCYDYKCKLDVVEKCGLEMATAKLPAKAKGSLNIDLVRNTAWGFFNLLVNGTIGEVKVLFEKNVFPYTDNNPLNIAALLENGDFTTLCSLLPTDLNLQIPKANIQDFFPLKINTGFSLYPSVTVPKTAVPSYEIGGQTIKLSAGEVGCS